jgi:hypothetical protein
LLTHTDPVFAECGTLRRTIDDDRYPLSPRVQTLKAILAKIQPEPAQEPFTAAEAICAAASDDGQKAPLGALALKSEPGSPMALRTCGAASVIRGCSADCAHDRRHPDNAGISHALRHHHRPDRKAGQDI